ncbi:GIY-YIG nuclease family protein [Kaistia geumhonensis]|uniref:Bacteriophage T5 Orf172 DNA-binding domain-containing protein n=1 Tax=Kaistia geumhonensis TaxID=410839 RepID=A0ABU0M5R0_9HYPH|nr:GIY-YIG nuclease family protein [Kaistia geumhonensis]MCX5478492.1 GIY-YIG nuclease family protein [Kaistia geumhonensis]MDQ0516290.1 hypothetical protein [Kaistia geumhonensis]
MMRAKYLVEDVDRYGSSRFYVRRPGKKKIRITCEPGTAEFDQAYRDAMGEDFDGAVARSKHELEAKRGLRFLYVVSDGEAVKIGLATNLKGRLSSLQVSQAAPLACELLFETSADEAFPLEQSVHFALRTCAVRGEWFSVSADEAGQTILAVAKALRVRVRKSNYRVQLSGSVGL